MTKENYVNGCKGGEVIRKKRSGKTYEEIYGKEKAKQLKEKLSNVHKGTKSEKKGVTFEEYYGTDEADRIKKEIRKSVLKNFKTPKKAFKKGHVPWNKGKTMEELYGVEEAKRRKLEWKEKVRDKIILPLKDSTPEKKMHKILDKLGIKYRKHIFINNIKHKYQCDIFINPNIIIEVDGTYWHNYPNGRDIDDIRTKEMAQKGYTVFRYWEGMFDLEKIKNEVGYILGVATTKFI